MFLFHILIYSTDIAISSCIEWQEVHDSKTPFYFLSQRKKLMVIYNDDAHFVSEKVYTDIFISGHAIYENQTVKHRWCLYKIREQQLPYVGVTRLELATTRPPDAYANQLRHTPNGFCYFIDILIMPHCDLAQTAIAGYKARILKNRLMQALRI